MHVPASRPQITKAECEKILAHKQVEQPAILGIRGYYLDSMGEPGQNERGIFDDAVILVAPWQFKAFNGNTDPSINRKGVAVLKPGVWRYKKGKHKILSPEGYMALVQAGPVTVARDQTGDDTGFFGINIHRAGFKGTSSLGCQTIYRPQWEEFRDAVYGAIVRSNLGWIPYVLITEEERRALKNG